MQTQALSFAGRSVGRRSAPARRALDEAMEAICEDVGFTAAMTAVEDARKRLAVAHRAEAMRLGWVV